MNSQAVAVLFARADSSYKALPGVDVWDAQRDARKWPGGVPGVYHPPCRAWGQYKHRAKPRPDEKDLARWAVSMVRRFGGVIEHPYASELWSEYGMQNFGIRDGYGGVLFPVYQSWWGHRAPKKTCLYLVGGAVPDLSEFEGQALPLGRVEMMGRNEREATPPRFAEWLVGLARSCQVA
ncbi:hypothetical protein [Comamonas sp.]|uniref:hypothetical protein n=1 Tax=Comamonas sp. TaxID=34028 RepID=UPI003A8FD055